jgi:integrase
MLWAAFCLGFFGFMRSGEFTSSLSQDPDACTLSVADVAIDSRHNPQVLTVLIRRSKTDQSGTGTHLYLGRTGTTLCPVSAVLAYLAIRPPTPGPLFVFQDGTPLSRDKLVSQLRDALSLLGIDAMNFSGHSFRIGAATTAAKAGFDDSLIQTLGRWKSNAFTTYIRTSAEDLAAASAILSHAS